MQYDLINEAVLFVRVTLSAPCFAALANVSCAFMMVVDREAMTREPVRLPLARALIPVRKSVQNNSLRKHAGGI
jgi:hypothetical protein